MYKCNCGKDFEKIGSLNSHARFCKEYVKKEKKTVYKNEEGVYTCECGKTFEKSQSLNSHFSRCKTHRNGTPPITQRNGGGWNVGLTKENNLSVAKMANSLSVLKKGKPGNKHTEETKRKMSLKRIEFLENNPDNNILWYVVNNGEKDIKVQGEWERNVANWLNDLNIKWDRHKISYDVHRNYTPDFWLPEYNFYLEVKGWLSDRDRIKMKKVIEQTGIKIKMLNKSDYVNLEKITPEDLEFFT